MKKSLKKAMSMMIVATMVFSLVVVSAAGEQSPNNADTKTARFYIMQDYNVPNVDFSMLSKDGELVIHINKNTKIYYENLVMVRDTLGKGETLEEVLDGRKLEVTYDIVTMSLPGQTSPISIKVLNEYIAPSESVFEDVDSSDWFYTPAMWCYDNGIMNGVSKVTFAPEKTMTRAMLVTVLWRYAGMEKSGTSTFSDVPDGEWYSEAVVWAAEANIVNGVGDGLFAPHQEITREQMYTILYRYMNCAKLTIKLEDEMRVQFADEGKINDWAKDALHVMYDAGVMYSDSTLDNYARPQDGALREEIAGAMYFFDMYAVPVASK